MNYRTYISTLLKKFNLSQDELDLILVENSIVESEIVDVLIAKKAIYNSLSTMIPLYSSVSEGGVSVTWNFEAIKVFYESICSSLGLENKLSKPENEIRDRSNMW